jgi:hypothetical protein
MNQNDEWLIGKLTTFRHNHDYDWIMDRVREWEVKNNSKTHDNDKQGLNDT